MTRLDAWWSFPERPPKEPGWAAAAMKPGNKLDRENITDGEREAGAYEQAVVQETRTGMTWRLSNSSSGCS